MAETKTTKKLPENCSRFRSFVYRLVESKLFGAAILFVILSNTVVLIVNTSEEISVKGGIRLFIVNVCIIAHVQGVYFHVRHKFLVSVSFGRSMYSDSKIVGFTYFPFIGLY